MSTIIEFENHINDEIAKNKKTTLSDDQVFGDWLIKASDLLALAIKNNWLISAELVGLPAWDITFGHDCKRAYSKKARFMGLTAEQAKGLGISHLFCSNKHRVVKACTRALPSFFWPDGIPYNEIPEEAKFETIYIWDESLTDKPIEHPPESSTSLIGTDRLFIVYALQETEGNVPSVIWQWAGQDLEAHAPFSNHENMPVILIMARLMAQFRVVKIEASFNQLASLEPPAQYRHYKGNVYEVLTEAKLEATGEELVVYRSTKEPKATWARSKAEFFSAIPRFEKIG